MVIYQMPVYVIIALHARMYPAWACTSVCRTRFSSRNPLVKILSHLILKVLQHKSSSILN